MKKERKEKNKKGLELAISTIVLFALGIMVLIGLVLMFTGQAKNFMEYINIFSSESNVDAMLSRCVSFADSGPVQEYSFCCEEREITFADGKKESLTCKQFSESSISAGKIKNMTCDIKC